MIELSIATARAVELAHALKTSPAGLRIKPEEIDLIRAFVRQALALHPQWQRLLRELGRQHERVAQPNPP